MPERQLSSLMVRLRLQMRAPERRMHFLQLRFFGPPPLAVRVAVAIDAKATAASLRAIEPRATLAPDVT
jgi:hypothetical protein